MKMMVNTMIKFLAFSTLILLLTSSGLGYLLKEEYKVTGKLSGEITSLEEKLTTCSSEKKKFILDQKSTDKLLSEALEKQGVIEDEFGDLQYKLENQRCSVGVNKRETKTTPDVDTVAAIASVRLLLDKAACTANSNCSDKPSESSSKPL